jgi:hypothetical protein
MGRVLLANCAARKRREATPAAEPRCGLGDPVTLKNLFDQDGALLEIGGAQYLVHLASSVVTVINAEDYTGILQADAYGGYDHLYEADRQPAVLTGGLRLCKRWASMN